MYKTTYNPRRHSAYATVPGISHYQNAQNLYKMHINTLLAQILELTQFNQTLLKTQQIQTARNS